MANTKFEQVKASSLVIGDMVDLNDGNWGKIRAIDPFINGTISLEYVGGGYSAVRKSDILVRKIRRGAK